MSADTTSAADHELPKVVTELPGPGARSGSTADQHLTGAMADHTSCRSWRPPSVVA